MTGKPGEPKCICVKLNGGKSNKKIGQAESKKSFPVGKPESNAAEAEKERAKNGEKCMHLSVFLRRTVKCINIHRVNKINSAVSDLYIFLFINLIIRACVIL